VTFLGTACTGLAFGMWYVAVREIGTSAAGAYLYLEPFVTWMVAAVVLGEQLTWLGLAGGCVVLTGVWMVSSAGRGVGKGT
jgi:drug/metabolite transporter (DMT)-like permease